MAYKENINISAGTTSNARTNFTFSNANGVTFGLNDGTITASVNPGAGGGIANAAGTQTATSGTVVFSNSNNVSFGMSNNSVITASFNPINIGISNLGNTGGTTGTFDGANLQYIFVGENGIRLSQSSNGSSVSLTINRMPVNTYIPYYPASTGVQTLGALANTTASAFFFPVSIQDNVNFNELRLLEFFSFNTTSNSSGAQTLSRSIGIYTNNNGTLSQISSASMSLGITQSSGSATISWASATNTTGYGYGTSSASTSAQAHSLWGTVGNRAVGYQFGNTMSLSAGLYWVGFMERKSSSNTTGVGFSNALAGNVMAAAQNIGLIGSGTTNFTAGTNATRIKFGWGPYTSTGSAGYGGTALPQSAFLTGIANTMTIMPMMTFIST